MNLHELFEKFETEFLAGHEKIKTGLDLELFVNKLCEQILGDVYDLEPIYKTGGNNFAVTAVGNGNCIINVLPGGANINCSVGICGTANLFYTDTYNFY